MSQYERLDWLILVTLSGRPRNFTELQSGALWAECIRLESATGSDSSRILDRRLQALRKAGKIEYTGAKVGQGWTLRGDQQ